MSHSSAGEVCMEPTVTKRIAGDICSRQNPMMTSITSVSSASRVRRPSSMMTRSTLTMSPVRNAHPAPRAAA